MSSQQLPLKTSPEVFLAVATLDEVRQTWRYNSAEWQGPLPLEAYFQREEHLLGQDLTKDGGLTSWVLVHQPSTPNAARTILCACETIKKKAFLAVHGIVKEVTCHGVASVFCPAEHRGRGYAARMIADLSKKIEHWQHEDQSVLFSILYSDIGKIFYATLGWQPFNSSHIQVPASSRSLPANTRFLSTNDIPSLCDADTTAIRISLAQASRVTSTVSVIPDARTIAWHQARGDFFAQELLGKVISNKGALVELSDGRRAWCYWQHNWQKIDTNKDNKLYILRISVEDGNENEQADLIEPLLAAAQAEAASWNLHCVELWSPSQATKIAATRCDDKAQEVHRDDSSITSLLWFGDGSWRDVQWVNNERFGWC